MSASGNSSPFRSGFVALVGRPNVGKSTLFNALLGEKLAIVTDKPQTTRNRIRGILNLPGVQVIFLDTPGIHKPQHRMNEIMVKNAVSTLGEVDLVCLLVEAAQPPGAGDRFIIDLMKRAGTPAFLVINKTDLVRRETLLPFIDEARTLHPFAEVIPVSAVTGENLEDLKETIVRAMPEGPRLFPEDMKTDQTERFLASELIREQVFLQTKEEVPYSTAVVVEEMKDRPEGTIYIRALVVVERESHKGIVIGRKGARLKAIGQAARHEVERILGAKAYLELFVKVKPRWREEAEILRDFGYTIEGESS
ncbi:MAG: GTPase Era [Nitrospirae bacterium]|nr:GTPase Era [Nitrospirota bacterium]